MMRRLLLLLAAMGLLTTTSAAQEESHRHELGAPGAELGRVTFPIDCGRGTQPRFERAVALLHSFWYEEAGLAFREIAQTDSTCPMAHWGEAMSLLHPLWTPPTAPESEQGLHEAQLAVRLSRPGTRERAYADAIAAYYTNFTTIDHKTRLLAYERAMSKLAARYPRDDEGRIFYALALIADGQNDPADTTLSRQRRAGELLEPLFRRHPKHPGLAHYLIHAYDYPALAARGIQAAERYALIAPSVPHAQHMPSHIYVRVGRWDDVITSNLRSAESAIAFERSQGSVAMWDQRAHALDYLVYAYLQERRDSEALAVVEEIDRANAVFPPGLIGEYALAAIPARYVLERGDWAAAETLSVRPDSTWRGTEAITYFSRAIGAARAGHATATRAAIDSLSAIEAALARAGGPQTYWSGQARIQRMAASAWLVFLQGDTAQAVSQARAAADLEDATPKHPVTPGAILPARELLGDLLIDAHRKEEARQAYATSLRLQPGRARSRAGEALASR